MKDQHESVLTLSTSRTLRTLGNVSQTFGKPVIGELSLKTETCINKSELHTVDHFKDFLASGNVSQTFGFTDIGEHHLEKAETINIRETIL